MITLNVSYAKNGPLSDDNGVKENDLKTIATRACQSGLAQKTIVGAAIGNLADWLGQKDSGKESGRLNKIVIGLHRLVNTIENDANTSVSSFYESFFRDKKNDAALRLAFDNVKIVFGGEENTIKIVNSIQKFQFGVQYYTSQEIFKSHPLDIGTFARSTPHDSYVAINQSDQMLMRHSLMAPLTMYDYFINGNGSDNDKALSTNSYPTLHVSGKAVEAFKKGFESSIFYNIKLQNPPHSNNLMASLRKILDLSTEKGNSKTELNTEFDKSVLMLYKFNELCYAFQNELSNKYLTPSYLNSKIIPAMKKNKEW